MRRIIIALFALFLASYANAAPTLFDPLPANNSFFGRGTVNFSINVTSTTLDTNSVRLFVISEDAYINGDPWNNYTMQCTNYASNNWNCSSQLTFSIVASDTLEFFYFEAADSGGKGSFGNENASLRFKIDRTPPSVTFVMPRNSSYVSGVVNVEITISDSVSGVNTSTTQFSLDNSSWLNMTGNAGSWNSTTYSNNQTVFIYVRVSDNVGNSNITLINVTVDNEKPSIVVISPESGATVKDAVDFSINVSDIYSGINMTGAKVNLAGTDFPLTCNNNSHICGVSINTVFVSDGTYSAVFHVTDKASNLNTSSVSINVKNTKPSISISPSGGYVSGTRTIGVSVMNSNSTITNISLKMERGSNITNVLANCNAGFTSCTYPWNTYSFTDGIYTVTASAGNIQNNNISAAVTLTVDNTIPSITLDIPDIVKTSFTARANIADTNHNNTATFRFNSDSQPMTCVAQSATLFCEIDYNPSYLGDGNYNITINTTDKAGNSASAAKTISLDVLPPEVKFSKIEPISSEYYTDVTFTVSVEDKGTGVSDVTITVRNAFSQEVLRLAKNGDVWQSKLAVRADGGYNVDVYAEDFAGNSRLYEKNGYFYIGQLSCGDGICQAHENYCICASDCARPVCQEEINCASGLPVCGSSVCGDGICSQSETCSSCQKDCGLCVPGDRNTNPLGIGGGNFSEFIISNPLVVALMGIILVALAAFLLKFKKRVTFPRHREPKPFILDDKK